MTAVLNRLDDGEVDAIDLFCGYGGSSQGMTKAGATLRLAANHAELPLECHAVNHPDVEHLQADLSSATDPRVMNRAGKMVTGRYMDPADLPRVTWLNASPSCKYHSLANAKKVYERGPQAALFDDGEPFDQVAYANSERSRVTMMCPLRYAAKHRPEIVTVENVVEAAKWGPARDGSTFRWWLQEWTNLGYEYEVLFLNSMFFPPCPQSRDRMYVVCWRKGNRRPDLRHTPRALCTSDRCQGRLVDAVQTWKHRKASWPLPRWGKYGTQYVYTCPECRAEVVPAAWPAYSAIDWSRLGIAIGDRPKHGMEPLAESTLERVRRGLQKFRNSPPVIVPLSYDPGGRPVTEPMRALTTQGDKALAVQGGVTPLRTNGTMRHPTEHLPTQVAGNVGQALAFTVKNNGGLDEAKYRAHHAGLPLGALTTQGGQSIATIGATMPVGGNDHERPGQTRAKALDDPLFTLTATQSFGLAHQPALVEMRGGGSKEAGQHPVTDPMHTVTAGGMHHALMSTLGGGFVKQNGAAGDTAWHDPVDPFGTITGRDSTGLMILPWLDQWRSEPTLVTDQMATIMTHLRHSLASIEVSGSPVDDDELMRVCFRMLDPDTELRRGMAFRDDYILLGNKTQMTAGLGNSVTPPVQEWIGERVMASLR